MKQTENKILLENSILLDIWKEFHTFLYAPNYWSFILHLLSSLN